MVIVGGGAAGLACAIFAARRLPQRSIVVLDGAKKLGAKILVAGGGRCNVTNCTVTTADYFGGSRNLIKHVLAALPVDRTIAFFREIGVELKVEEHGKMFPTTNQARTVLEALLAETKRCGVTICPAHRVTTITPCNDGFQVDTSVTKFRARRVVLATGGRSLPKTGSDGVGFHMAQALGHSIIPVTPALVPLVLEGDFHAPLSGIAQDVEVTAMSANAKPIRIRGALLWTHFGVSGPVVLDISRHWHRARLEGHDISLTLNFFPGDDFSAADQRLLDLASAKPKALLRNSLSTMLPARVAEAVLGKLSIDGAITMANLSKEVRRRLVHGLTGWPLPVRDSRGYAYAEVTAGGIPLSEIDSRSMASRECPGLFLVGEILDVDGRIGGFNFQWAWSSGFVAGLGLAKSFESRLSTT